MKGVGNRGEGDTPLPEAQSVPLAEEQPPAGDETVTVLASLEAGVPGSVVVAYDPERGDVIEDWPPAPATAWPATCPHGVPNASCPGRAPCARRARTPHV